MNRAFAAVLLLAVFRVPATAWQWPVQQTDVMLTSVEVAFGQSDSGVYSRGILIAGARREVFPVAGGTVVYVRDGDAAGAQLGVTVVVDHDRGFRSFYGHLQPGTTPTPGTPVTESTQIGVAGESGATTGPSVFFSVLDTQTGVYVNPLLLLPAITDQVSPTISSVLAQTDTSLFDLGSTAVLPAGDHLLLVECFDRWAPGGHPVAPHSLAVLVDGREQLSVRHETIDLSTGSAVLRPGPGLPHDGLRTRTGEFIAGVVAIPIGRTLIEIIVGDFGGNETSVVVEVTGEP